MGLAVAAVLLLQLCLVQGQQDDDTASVLRNLTSSHVTSVWRDFSDEITTLCHVHESRTDPQHAREMAALRWDLQSLKERLDARSIYTHWGRRDCPDGASLVYEGMSFFYSYLIICYSTFT